MMNLIKEQRQNLNKLSIEGLDDYTKSGYRKSISREQFLILVSQAWNRRKYEYFYKYYYLRKYLTYYGFFNKQVKV